MKTANSIYDAIKLVQGYELSYSSLHLITIFAFALAIIAGIVVLVLGDYPSADSSMKEVTR